MSDAKKAEPILVGLTKIDDPSDENSIAKVADRLVEQADIAKKKDEGFVVMGISPAGATKEERKAYGREMANKIWECQNNKDS